MAKTYYAGLRVANSLRSQLFARGHLPRLVRAGFKFLHVHYTQKRPQVVKVSATNAWALSATFQVSSSNSKGIRELSSVNASDEAKETVRLAVSDIAQLAMDSDQELREAFEFEDKLANWGPTTPFAVVCLTQ